MMKYAALFLALSVVLVAGCQPKDGGTNEGGSNTTPPSGGSGESTTSQTDDNATTVAFSDVQGILNANCTGCHGATDPKEGINLTSYDTLMKGGEHGPVVVAGDPENSVIVQVLRGSHGKPQMPPQMDPLPEADIAKIEQWIKEGAKS